MQGILAAEGIRQVEPVAGGSLSADQDQTLLCFVLVDPEGRHAFCRWAGLQRGSGNGQHVSCNVATWCILGWHASAQADRSLCDLPACLPPRPLPRRSRYDFGPWPLLSFVRQLPDGVQAVLQDTEALFINGFVFDELPAEAVLAAATAAQAAGAAVFFDPGGPFGGCCGASAVGGCIGCCCTLLHLG